jgi:hypothetical protein
MEECQNCWEKGHCTENDFIPFTKLSKVFDPVVISDPESLLQTIIPIDKSRRGNLWDTYSKVLK